MTSASAELRCRDAGEMMRYSRLVGGWVLTAWRSPLPDQLCRLRSATRSLARRLRKKEEISICPCRRLQLIDTERSSI